MLLPFVSSTLAMDKQLPGTWAMLTMRTECHSVECEIPNNQSALCSLMHVRMCLWFSGSLAILGQEQSLSLPSQKRNTNLRHEVRLQAWSFLSKSHWLWWMQSGGGGGRQTSGSHFANKNRLSLLSYLWVTVTQLLLSYIA